MATPPDNKHETIRERNVAAILAAAEIEFSEKGMRGASMQAVADRAGLPKANVHYYFKSKKKLYLAVLNRTLELWNASLGEISEDDDPRAVIERFIREKMTLARTHPRASRLFAMEVIQGAPFLKDYLRGEMREWVREKARIFQRWIDDGRMAPVDPVYLIFLIWSATQHYADFETQVLTIQNKAEYEDHDIEAIADFLCTVIVEGCGIRPKRSAGRRAARG